MRIAWLIGGLAMNGAVREIVETCNVLVARGHDVTIYTPDGDPCQWLPCTAKTDRQTTLRGQKFDVALSASDWQRDQHKAFDAVAAKVKVINVLGFTPGPDIEAVWTGRKPSRDVGEDLQRLAIHKYLVLTDSSWQRDWLKAHVGVDTLPPFGGVNPAQFHPVPQRHSKTYLLVGSTGDPRQRKGGDVIAAAKGIIAKTSGVSVRFTDYWHKGIAQDKMSEWYASCDVFIDAERRAGWANPVAEAMACGTACVCQPTSAPCGTLPSTAKQHCWRPSTIMPRRWPTQVIRLLRDADLRQRIAGTELPSASSWLRLSPGRAAG